MIYSKIFFIMCLATNALGASESRDRQKPFARGGQGTIYKREHEGRIIVEKVISSEEPDAHGMELVREDKMARLIESFREHPPQAANADDWKYIPQLYDTIDKSEEEGKLILQYEFIEGTHSEVNGTFPFENKDESTMLRYLQQIAMALRALHSVRILHNDIKPANIIIDDEHKRAVLIDFGISMRIPENEDSLMVLVLPGGSAKYFPGNPERLNRTFKGEVFALGRVFMEAFNLLRYESYYPRRGRRVSRRASHRWVTKNADGRISQETQEFMKLMTHRDSKKRPSINEVVEFCERQMMSLQPAEVVSNPPSDSDTDMSLMEEKASYVLEEKVDVPGPEPVCGRGPFAIVSRLSMMEEKVDVPGPEPVCLRGPFPVGSRIMITDKPGRGTTGIRIDGTVQEIKTCFWDRRHNSNDDRTLYAGSRGRVVEVRNGDIVVEWDKMETLATEQTCCTSSFPMEWVARNRSKISVNFPFEGRLVKQS